MTSARRINKGLPFKMYEKFWSINEKPFENTPDPRFFYASPQHEEALARLFYCIQEGKPAGMLTGVFGCGKTAVLNVLMQHLNQERYRVAYLRNPRVDDTDLLRLMVYYLGNDQPPKDKGDILMVMDALLQENAREGRQVVIIVDEAHAIVNAEVYEELRLLLNFQETNRSLLSLLIAGQPELTRVIEQNKPFEQRIAIKAHLEPFDRDAIERYIAHRLRVAGCRSPETVFSKDAVGLIYESTGGIPRRVNRICDICMLSAMDRGADKIDQSLVRDELGSVSAISDEAGG